MRMDQKLENKKNDLEEANERIGKLEMDLRYVRAKLKKLEGAEIQLQKLKSENEQLKQQVNSYHVVMKNISEATKNAPLPAQALCDEYDEEDMFDTNFETDEEA